MIGFIITLVALTSAPAALAARPLLRADAAAAPAMPTRQLRQGAAIETLQKP